MKEGVVIVPVISLENGVAELLMITPQDENNIKLGESCPLIEGVEMQSLAGKPEFPGGAVEIVEGVKEGIVEAALREFIDETGVIPADDFVERLHFLFDDFPIDQLRPEMTNFAVAVALLELSETEVEAMEEKGARRILVSMVDGKVIDKETGDSLLLRPAHEVIIQYMAGIAHSFTEIYNVAEVYA